MIEGGYKYYEDKPDKLLDLCKLNNLSNIYFLKHKLNIDSLYELSQREHFDVVLAFLVIHIMSEQNSNSDEQNLENAKKYIEILFSLGSNVIIETSTEICPFLDQYMMRLCNELNGEYLGELPRYKDKKKNNSNGRFYWFKNEDNRGAIQTVSQETFKLFNGVFPENSLKDN